MAFTRAEISARYAARHPSARKEINARSYARHRDKNISRAKEQWRRWRDFLAWLKSLPCTDCGRTFPPEAMDFDHVRPKRFHINNACNRTLQDVQDEMTNCELVCACCHRVRTLKRLRDAELPSNH